MLTSVQLSKTVDSNDAAVLYRLESIDSCKVKKMILKLCKWLSIERH